MARMITCPTCGNPAVDVYSYVSIMVVRRDLALFKVECSACHTVTSSLQTIPVQLREFVQSAALEVGAGMGMGS